jgi:DNA excision repair protein ERCC-4
MTPKSVPKPKPLVIDLVNDVEDQDAWDALDEMEGRVGLGATDSGSSKNKAWIPDGMEPVLEELPKWSLLTDVMEEIEQEMMRQESLGKTPSSRRFYLALHNGTPFADLDYLFLFCS